MNTQLVHTAFSFLQQVLQQEPQAREQLLQMLRPEISVTAREETGNRPPPTMPQLLAKKNLNKQDWQDVFTHHLNIKKLPISLQNFYKKKLSKM